MTCLVKDFDGSSRRFRKFIADHPGLIISTDKHVPRDNDRPPAVSVYLDEERMGPALEALRKILQQAEGEWENAQRLASADPEALPF